MNDMIYISPELVREITTTLGTLVGIILTAWTGYFVWNLKQKKMTQSISDAKDRILLEKIEKLDNTVEQIAREQKRIMQGLSMALQSDIIQFRAFRKEKRLNGDSEAQEKKINDYLLNELYLKNYQEEASRPCSNNTPVPDKQKIAGGDDEYR